MLKLIRIIVFFLSASENVSHTPGFKGFLRLQKDIILYASL